MSRIGRLPFRIPKGVKVSVTPGTVKVEGAKSSVTRAFDPDITVAVEGDAVVVGRKVNTKRARAMHGLVRNLIKNDLIGLSAGFAKVLVISGVGYKAEIKGKNLVLALGYSTPIEYPVPEGIAIEVEANTRVTVRGADRGQVGQVASEIRSFRPTEPYKGKGIRYDTEHVRRKVGKSGIK
ncbi:MAG: 50S ribosomal protein L6 [Spirochaetes bacterium]|nr:50S ribosomal protein L6 [Spirochaetota bacterium]